MKVSIFDVAKKSGLSVVTVSRVLNNSTSVREKNRQKVLAVMKELDYHPNAAARSLARGETRIIGLIVTTLKDSFLDEIVREITNAAAEQGYFVALSVSSGIQERKHYLFQEDRVDGVLILSPIYEEEYVLELKKNQIPFVMLDNQQINSPATTVIVDNYKGGYEATKHLIDLGHREIAHISGPQLYLSSRERERGFLAALEEADLKPFSIDRGEFEISTGYTVARGWLESGNLPTALFASDDNIALGAMNYLINEGLKVPGDISIVGFDDQFMASQFRPMLTTIRQPADQIGRMGVELLIKNMKSPSKRSVTIQLSPELIVRESTGRRE